MKTALVLLASTAFVLGGCTTDYQTQRQIECAGGVLGGAAVGGILGNQVGGGKGKRVATAVGAGAGAAAGTRLPSCR